MNLTKQKNLLKQKHKHSTISKNAYYAKKNKKMTTFVI